MRPLMHRFGAAFAVAVLSLSAATVSAQDARVRARDLGIAPGIFATGEHNAITDVEGVRVGHATVREGDTIRTGVTAILPHAGNAYLSRVPAAIHVGNGFGKLAGSTQVGELGELETPILLTCTLCVWKAADAIAEWMLRQPGMEKVQSINPVVGETNDGGLNDIRARPITAAHVRLKGVWDAYRVLDPEGRNLLGDLNNMLDFASGNLVRINDAQVFVETLIKHIDANKDS